MSDWRVARSLLQLLKQVNQASPRRAKGSDGTIGDASHSARASDHNPDVDDVVKAMDITHDPAHGVDSYKLADALKASKDRRIKYIISNHRIWNPSKSSAWRSYDGKNPHTQHVHVSVLRQKALYDDVSPWKIGALEPVDGALPVKDKPVLRRGDRGQDVTYLQALLSLHPPDGNFGPRTYAAVIEWQRKHGLVVDGVVGAYTWASLLEGVAT